MICVFVGRCRANGHSHWCDLVVDYACFFDIVNKSITLRKMKELQVPDLLRRAVFRATRAEAYPAGMRNCSGINVKVDKGVVQ